MDASQSDTDELLRAAQLGDDTARQRWLARHRSRLRQVVAVHLNRRLAARMIRRIQDAMNGFRPDDHELLVKRYPEEMSAAEIGAGFDIGTGAVRTRHVRALARLQGRRTSCFVS
jgi:DNA-directed RNA polymerase specialized sigma24 family protein